MVMSMRTLVINGEMLTVRRGVYQDGNLALVLTDEDSLPYGKLTVNLDVVPPAGTAFLDTNNMPEAAQLLIDAGAGALTGATEKSGWCTYPLFAFSEEWLKGVQEL